MARPSLAAERRPQIIAATVQCVALNGVSGTTLERIADLAGMARGHVRHFAGNRDDLLTDAARVFFFGDAALDESDVAVLERTAPLVRPDADLAAALDYLFDEFAEPGAENAAAFAFIDAGRSIPAVLQIVLAAYRSIEDSLATILRRTRPSRSDELCRQDAFSVFALAIGNSTLNDLQPSSERNRQTRAAAERLLASGD